MEPTDRVVVLITKSGSKTDKYVRICGKTARVVGTGGVYKEAPKSKPESK